MKGNSATAKQSSLRNFFNIQSSTKNIIASPKEPKNAITSISNDQEQKKNIQSSLYNQNVEVSAATESDSETVMFHRHKRLRKSLVIDSDEETQDNTCMEISARKIRKLEADENDVEEEKILKSSPQPNEILKFQTTQNQKVSIQSDNNFGKDNIILVNTEDENDLVKLNGRVRKSVLDLTFEQSETVWNELNLVSTNAGEKIKERVIRELDHYNQKIENDGFDWHSWLLGLPITSNSLYFREYAEIISSNEIQCLAENKGDDDNDVEVTKSRSFPSWLMPSNIKDKNGLRPDHPKYDTKTLFIPKKGDRILKLESKHFTPALEQYWEVKSEHFDKIVLFKIGKFYEIFYIDAFITHRLCGLKWMGHDEKPHVGFPEPSLHQYAELLVKKGFKVVVVEQMETPKELEERNKKGGSKSKAVKREVCEMYSIGTVLHESMLPPESQLLLSIVYSDNKEAFGFAFCDVSTCRISVGQSLAKQLCTNQTNECNTSEGKYDISLRTATTQALKSLLHQINAVEVVIDQSNVPSEVMKILRLLPVPPHINLSHLNRFSDCAEFDEMKELIGAGLKVEGSETIKQNQVVLSYLESNEEALLSVVSLSRYLEEMLLKQKVLSFARLETFDIYLKSGMNGGHDRNRLILDSTTLRHLSLLQARDGTTRGTLFEYLNQTKTRLGFRLLRRWLAAPLRNPKHINERLDAVEWFIHNDDALSRFRSEISKIPDVERLLTKVCTRGLQGLRSAVYFDDVHSKHFAEFVNLLDSLDAIQSALLSLGSFGSEKGGFPSRLTALCCLSTTPTPGVLPDISSAVAEVKDSLEQNSSTKHWTLKEGVDVEYDCAVQRLNTLDSKLLDHLEELIQKSKSVSHSNQTLSYKDIKYVHAKYDYEIECPEKHRFWKDVQKLDPIAVDVTSSRSGYVRFRTSAILDFVDQLDSINQQLKDCLYGCQQRLFQKFYHNHYDSCLFIIAAVAEMDVLAAFAVVSLAGSNVIGSVSIQEAMCRPRFVECQKSTKGENQDTSIVPHSSDYPNVTDWDGPPMLRLINSRHPIVADSLRISAGQYVPNDIRLGDPTNSSGSQTFFLVTGPNMGGKSTLLRQACLVVIIAQVGCFVPSTECVLSPVDRIFTRLGAYDSILEGKSTFLVELEETAVAVKEASIHSLVVLDELGRGTTTFDGAAIAFAVSEHLANVTKCRTLFSTHFQVLCDELEDSLNVRNVHMQARLDEETSTLTFLYKLIGGACPKSHGLLVAKMAGINEQILSNAEKKAEEFRLASNEIYTIAKLRSLSQKIFSTVRVCNKDTSMWRLIYQKLKHLLQSQSIRQILFPVVM